MTDRRKMAAYEWCISAVFTAAVGAVAGGIGMFVASGAGLPLVAAAAVGAAVFTASAAATTAVGILSKGAYGLDGFARSIIAFVGLHATVVPAIGLVAGCVANMNVDHSPAPAVAPGPAKRMLGSVVLVEDFQGTCKHAVVNQYRNYLPRGCRIAPAA